MAGPGGALLAFGLVGLVAISVMEGICEMILHWPIPNAMVEFVKAFVDHELGIVVGLGYWLVVFTILLATLTIARYTYSVTFSALIISAMNLAEYWGISAMWKSICYVFIPIALGAINSRQVQVFATIELFGGIAKLCLVAGIVILLICINLGAHGQKPIHSHNLNYGLQFNKNVADGYWAAVCNAIPLAIFAYLGIELVTMTAFEATLPVANSLRWPARNIAWIVTSIYLVTTCVFVINVYWRDPKLPQFFNQGISGLVGGATTRCAAEHNTTIAEETPKFSAAVIAVNDAGLSGGILIACFIYSTLSAANTGLFTASRAVYGLARDIRIEASSPWWLRMLAAPASVEPRTQSPWWAISISVLLLCWLPFIHLAGGYTLEEV